MKARVIPYEHRKGWRVLHDGAHLNRRDVFDYGYASTIEACPSVSGWLLSLGSPTAVRNQIIKNHSKQAIFPNFYRRYNRAKSP